MRIRLIEDIDSNGNELSPSQEAFFKRSKVRNNQGELLVVYRGTVSIPERKQFLGSIKWFTSDREYANKYVISDNNVVYSCYLNCVKVFDCGNTDGRVFNLNPTKLSLTKEFTNILSRLNLTEQLFVTMFKEELMDRSSYTWHIYTIVRTEKFADLVRRSGYDCIRTIEEGNNVCWGVLHDRCIKLISNKEPTNSNNINESLKKATPYMLRNDGKLFECNLKYGNYHPYILQVYDDKNDIDSLVLDRLDELKWFYDHTKNQKTKEYIGIIYKSLTGYNEFGATDNTYIVKDDELKQFVIALNDEVNNEFCRVRTSNVKYGGNNNDIYFRISSVGFNWFPIIWDLVAKNKDIETVTIARDGKARDYSQGECYKINGQEMNHIPRDEFLSIGGNPIIEKFNFDISSMNIALDRLSQGKSLDESLPDIHPRYMNSYFRAIKKEQLKNDMNMVLEDLDIAKTVEKHFGTLDEPYYGKTYIMPDGRFLDMRNVEHHSDIEKWLIDQGLSDKEYIGNSGSQTMRELGAIRCDNRRYYMELPPIDPTQEQYNSLLYWLDLHLSKTRAIEVVTQDGKQVMYRGEENVSDDIVDKIRRYYIMGVLLESKDKIVRSKGWTYDRLPIGHKIGELTEETNPPKKTGKAYKVFKVKKGKLYPPMVANAGGKDTPVGVWLEAEEGEFAGLSKTGRKQVKSTGSGTLSYRPGWHLGDVPRAPQFDRTNKETGEKEFPKDFVWAECDYAMDVDYQLDADEQGYMRTKVDDEGNVITTRSDKYQHSLAGLPRLPKDGYYRYRTNPRPDTVPWVITGKMRVNKLLSDDEVNEILRSKGIEPIHRQGGDKTLAELGLHESFSVKKDLASKGDLEDPEV